MNSMTGFGRAAAQTDRYNILVEISGVNRKQTEIAVNVPRGYAEWDASVRSIVQGAVSRGRVGVSISVERLEEADGSLQLDEQKLASLAELLHEALQGWRMGAFVLKRGVEELVQRIGRVRAEPRQHPRPAPARIERPRRAQHAGEERMWRREIRALHQGTEPIGDAAEA